MVRMSRDASTTIVNYLSLETSVLIRILVPPVSGDGKRVTVQSYMYMYSSLLRQVRRKEAYIERV